MFGGGSVSPCRSARGAAGFNRLGRDPRTLAGYPRPSPWGLARALYSPVLELLDGLGTTGAQGPTLSVARHSSAEARTWSSGRVGRRCLPRSLRATAAPISAVQAQRLGVLGDMLDEFRGRGSREGNDLPAAEVD